MMMKGHGMPAGHTPKRTGNDGAAGVGAAEGGQNLTSAPGTNPSSGMSRNGMPVAVDTPSSGGPAFTTMEKSAAGVPSTPKSN